MTAKGDLGRRRMAKRTVLQSEWEWDGGDQGTLT